MSSVASLKKIVPGALQPPTGTAGEKAPLENGEAGKRAAVDSTLDARLRPGESGPEAAASTCSQRVFGAAALRIVSAAAERPVYGPVYRRARVEILAPCA